MTEPAVYGVLAPLLLALVIAGLDARRSPGDAVPLAGLAAAAALLAGLVGLEGVPAFPPVAAKQKIFYAALAAGLLGSALDLTRSRRATRLVSGCGVCLAGILWIGWRPLTAGGDAPLRIAALCIGSVPVLLTALHLDAKRGALASGAVLLAAALALAGVSGAGASVTLAFFCAAAAAALAGVLTAAYARCLSHGVSSQALGATGVLTAGSALTSIAATLLLFTPHASVAALALVVFVPLAVLASFRLPLRAASEARLQPVASTAAGLLVTLLVCTIAVQQIAAPSHP